MSELTTILNTPMSQALAGAVAAAATPHPDAPPAPMPDWMRPEAEGSLRRLNIALEATEAAIIARWLVPLAAVVAKAPEGNDLRAKVQAMAVLLTDLPACCWTADTQRDAARTFKWWPSVAEVAEFVEPRATQMRIDRAALARLLREPARRGTPEARAETPEQRDAHAALNRATIEVMRAELAAKERAATSTGNTRANVLSPAQRIAEYRRLGQHAVADAIERANGMGSVTA